MRANQPVAQPKPLTSDEWTSPNEEISIGRDILGLLSSAMYVDPMTIYREYIQNAADSIDDARRQAVLATAAAGTVSILIDDQTRTLRIRDNGTGIPSAQFNRRLTALGASSKRGGAARGFRGVGRLSGLAYCQELIFRSRAQGESAVSELRWDCRQLKAALQSVDSNSDLRAVVREVVTHRKTSGDGEPSHFFEVEMKGVIRHKNDSLLNRDAIADYLGQVAPVPFDPQFRFADEIVAALRPHVAMGNLHIHINDSHKPLYRPFKNQLALGESETDEFNALQLHHLAGPDGEPAAICWVLHHGYSGAIPQASMVKGLRFRVGNIQIGHHALLEDHFTEPRFNGWAVGEIHVIDKRIVPNGRRDHFEQNTHYNNILNYLAPITRDISRRCRTSSIRRKWLRDFEVHHSVATEKIVIISQGTLPVAKRKELARSAERAITAMEKIANMDGLDLSADDIIAPRVKKIRVKLEKALKIKLEASPLADLPTAKRKMYEHLFSLIYECAANRIAAKSLVDRILQKVT